VGDLIADPSHRVFASAVSHYELHYKGHLGKLPSAVLRLGPAIRDCGFLPLSISIDHAAHAGSLKWDHRDPWDRLLAAQARLENCFLVSSDAVFDGLELDRLW
jgi:PIN domain nuclease of toxin-antitoxin system